MTLIAKNRLLWLLDKHGKPTGTVCQEFSVVRKKVDLIDDETTIFIRVWRGERYRDHKLERKNFDSKGLLSLLRRKNVNVPNDEDLMKEICTYAMTSDSMAPIEYTHKNLGFVEINNELVYLAGKPIGKLSEEELGSTYIDMKALRQRGDFASWKQVMHEEVLGNTPLELALAIGATAPLVYLLREDGIFAELPVIALIGESTTGKTLACRVMGAVDGSPAESIGRLKDLNSTMAAFFKMMASQQGTMFLFDEATGKGDWTISDAIYSLVKGVERARCGTNGELKDRASFSGTIVLSGEKSLLETGKLNMGMVARMVEISLPWAASKEHAESLCRKLHNNHGSAIYPLVEHILAEYAHNKKVFSDMFNAELSTLINLVSPINNVDARAFNIYATIIVGAKVARDAWKLPLDVDKIRDLICENYKNKQPFVSHAKRLYDLVISKVNQNLSAFPDKIIRSQLENAVCGRTLGRIDKRGNQLIIWITREAFDDFVKDQFPNAQQFFAELVAQDLMERDIYRHYTFKRRLLIGTCVCYGFKVNTLAGDDDVCKTPPKQKKKKFDINLLLDDDDDEVQEASAFSDIVAESSLSQTA